MEMYVCTSLIRDREQERIFRSMEMETRETIMTDFDEE